MTTYQLRLSQTSSVLDCFVGRDQKLLFTPGEVVGCLVEEDAAHGQAAVNFAPTRVGGDVVHNIVDVSISVSSPDVADCLDIWS